MEPQARCKGCWNLLLAPPGQPCPFCHTVNSPNKKANHLMGHQIFDYIDDSANNWFNDYHLNDVYGHQPGYSDPQPFGSGYYSPQQQPTVYRNNGYYSPVSPASTYGSGSYSQHYQPVHEPKRAVLCGVTYKGHRKTLPASVNNVRRMHRLLLKLGFPNASIRILTEEESDLTRTPTRNNIRTAMEWLTKGSRSGDSLVFYYAGHGSHVRDVNGDENDGFDEAICPVDYRKYGKILDDEVNDILVAPLPHGATLHSIMDTCFSGTLLDLPFLCRIDRRGLYNWEDHNPSHVTQYGGTSGGKAICISACDDHQNSADTSAFTGDVIGAFTYSFTQAVERGYNLTYGNLLDNIRKIIREAQQQVGINAPFESSTAQEPQLSSSKRFNIYSEPFIM
ncbi:hypothetical protein E3N88_40027 [Mikania micrantha]|uniref:Peptidase C14 caspase domain-containing protein n=1 Tax=Mikania micrantha TaxID=192012 RepID=A0A5N6LLF2_9ASTR|nr:hypothetical protein E3N88_40027 [Mikania micrantha]